jgi:hypothetical protein
LPNNACFVSTETAWRRFCTINEQRCRAIEHRLQGDEAMNQFNTKTLFDMLGVAGCDEYKNFVILYMENCVMARTDAPYMIHVRPAA